MPGIFATITLDDLEHWPHANYIDPVERTWLPGFAIFWAVLSTVLVCSRLVLKLQKRAGSFGLDDFLIFVGWAFATAFTSLACLTGWHLHVGRHVWDIPIPLWEPNLYVGWVAQVMFIFSTGATKCSVLVFYCRMVKDTYSKAWLYLVWTLLFITIGSWFGAFVSYCFMCIPLSTFWNIEAYLAGSVGNYHCINGDDLTIAVGVITIASDLYTAAVPCALFQYHDLGLPRRQRIMLNIIFCLGFVVTGVGVARTYYLWKIKHDVDLSWVGYDLYACSIVECQLGIICTCAPFLRAVLRKYFPDLANSLSSATPIQAASETATKISNRVRNSMARNSMTSTWRQSATLRGSRGSYVQELKDLPFTPIEDVVVEEKVGCLVREEGTGRLVYSAHGSKPSVSSITR